MSTCSAFKSFQRFQLVPLEDRVVLDGEIAHEVNQIIDEELFSDQITEIIDFIPFKDSYVAPVLILATSNDTMHKSINNIDGLAQAAADETTVIRYDTQSDTYDTLLQKIQDNSTGPIQHLAIAHHGASGVFSLFEGDDISLASLSEKEGSHAQVAFWKELSSLMSANGRIDLLACNLTADNQKLIDTLEQLTEVNFAASSNITGEGGDWVLETDDVDISSLYFDSDKLGEWKGSLNDINIEVNLPQWEGYASTDITIVDAGANVNQDERDTIVAYVKTGTPLSLGAESTLDGQEVILGGAFIAKGTPDSDEDNIVLDTDIPVSNLVQILTDDDYLSTYMNFDISELVNEDAEVTGVTISSAEHQRLPIASMEYYGDKSETIAVQFKVETLDLAEPLTDLSQLPTLLAESEVLTSGVLTLVQGDKVATVEMDTEGIFTSEGGEIDFTQGEIWVLQGGGDILLTFEVLADGKNSEEGSFYLDFFSVDRDRVNSINRMELIESGVDTGIFEGALSYGFVNQFMLLRDNVFEDYSTSGINTYVLKSDKSDIDVQYKGATNNLSVEADTGVIRLDQKDSEIPDTRIELSGEGNPVTKEIESIRDYAQLMVFGLFGEVWDIEDSNLYYYLQSPWVMKQILLFHFKRGGFEVEYALEGLLNLFNDQTEDSILYKEVIFEYLSQIDDGQKLIGRLYDWAIDVIRDYPIIKTSLENKLAALLPYTCFSGFWFTL